MIAAISAPAAIAIGWTMFALGYLWSNIVRRAIRSYRRDTRIRSGLASLPRRCGFIPASRPPHIRRA